MPDSLETSWNRKSALSMPGTKHTSITRWNDGAAQPLWPLNFTVADCKTFDLQVAVRPSHNGSVASVFEDGQDRAMGVEAMQLSCSILSDSVTQRKQAAARGHGDDTCLASVSGQLG